MSVFDDLSTFAALPRVTSLRLSPDGAWLAAVVQTVAGEPAKYVSSIWRIDTAPGGAAPVRLTRSVEGERAPEFTADGSLLFASARPAGPAVSGKPAADKPAAWLLPPGGGEARQVAAPPGGVAAIAAARGAPAFAVTAGLLHGAGDAGDDAARRKARTDAGVNAILHESGFVRFWDHDLGPDSLRLLLAGVPGAEVPGAAAAPPRDLTPDARRELDEQSFELAPDGSAAVTGWVVPGQEPGEWRGEIVVVPADGGPRRVLLSDPDLDYSEPRVSPDGSLVLAHREEKDSYDRPGDRTLVVVPLAGGEPRDLLAGFDRWPDGPVWAPDGASVFFAADDQGRRPVFRVALDSGEVTQVTSDAAAYNSICPAPDGSCLYALRNAIDAPPAPVRIDLAAPAAPAALPTPGAAVAVPGQLTEVDATAEDGTPLRGWLVLPEGASAASPAPLLLWVHGGPQSSWNSWSWRWSPWLMAARGYAVLLPDPALSTGYGQRMMQRGHGSWGDTPYTDVMAMTDAVIKRPDIDDARTGMMGGSFGGYMANWIAGQTDRFKAIVSHAGLWALDQMFGTTDAPTYWYRAWGNPTERPERYLASSPHLHVADIVTPMLIIHGDKDYRVPVGEALRIWTALTSHGKPAKFLYFPDENHWILKPGDVPVWYETVFAFLAEHVLGEPWQRPAML